MPRRKKKEEIKANQQLEDQVRIGEFAKSEDWNLAKRRLFDKLLQYDSLSVIYEEFKNKGIEEIGEIALVNGKIVQTIVEWISEIESDGQTLIANQLEMKKIKEDYIYKTTDPEEDV